LAVNATDGSYLTLNATLSGAGIGTHTIAMKNGTLLNPPLNLTGGYSGVSSSVTDANGNQISVSSTSTEVMSQAPALGLHYMHREFYWIDDGRLFSSTSCRV
jgi:hypothetical protein